MISYTRKAPRVASQSRLMGQTKVRNWIARQSLLSARQNELSYVCHQSQGSHYIISPCMCGSRLFEIFCIAKWLTCVCSIGSYNLSFQSLLSHLRVRQQPDASIQVQPRLPRGLLRCGREHGGQQLAHGAPHALAILGHLRY